MAEVCEGTEDSELLIWPPAPPTHPILSRSAMAQKRGSRVSSEDSEELARVPLQAVLLADSFTMKFRPITLERPKVLLPLVNIPMIEYSLAWLESVGVEEVFVFCCSHAEKVKDYLEKSHWFKNPTFTVTTIESHDSISAGDALRTIYNQSVIRGDFILISGDTVSNACLKRALQEHKDRRKKDPLAVMTMLIKYSKPSTITLQTRLGNDEIIMAIDPDTKQLLYYEDKADHLKGMISLDKSLLSDSCAFQLHNDKEDCYIDICSQEVLSLFTDNFDYQHLRRHFVKGLLVDDIMGYKIFTHEIGSSYAARVDNFRSYDTVSKDLIQRWAYPFVPDVQFSENCPHSVLEREGIYKEPDVAQSRSAEIGAFSVIGKDTVIGDGTKVYNSVVGRNCILGSNVSIKGCYIWDKVIIEDNCKLSHAIICDGVHLKAGAVLEPGVVLSYKVVVGQKVRVPAYSKVSLCPQPSQQDSDEELEYADANSAVIESPSITSALEASNSGFQAGADEATISGQGYIWSTCEGGIDDEWRYSVAPIPEEKLLEFTLNVSACPDIANEDPSTIPTSGELHPDSESIDPDDIDGEYGDADFEKEVEATFRRAVDEVPGVNQDHVILEVNSLKLSYNVTYADCAGALFQSVMKLGLAVPYSTNRELLQNAIQTISKWKDLLKHYIKTADEEIEVILKFEEMCLESTKEYAPLFSSILSHLYQEDLATEDAILTWASEKEGADDSDKVFVKQSERFIQWLKEASEEDDDE